jgi:hypothetical protein
MLRFCTKVSYNYINIYIKLDIIDHNHCELMITTRLQEWAIYRTHGSQILLFSLYSPWFHVYVEKEEQLMPSCCCAGSLHQSSIVSYRAAIFFLSPS